MDIKKTLDDFLGSEVAGIGSRDEKEQFACALLLRDFRNMEPEKMRKYLKDWTVNKKEQQITVTFAFPITFNPPNVI